MKIVVVPILKKLAAILVSFVPVGDFGRWLWNADIWTLIEFGSGIALFLAWFFVRYLPNFRLRTNETSRTGRVMHNQSHLPTLTENASYRARLWNGGRQFSKWLFAMVFSESRESIVNELHAKESSRARSHSRTQGLEPDAGPHRTLRQVTTAHRSAQRVRH